MQAGESLKFIPNPDEVDILIASPVESLNTPVETEQFCRLIDSLMISYPAGFRTLKAAQTSTGIDVIEGSFKATFGDGSYLHLVPYMYLDGDDIASIGLSVVEHNSDDICLMGYLFEVHENGVRYARHPFSGEEGEGYERHFSPINSQLDVELAYEHLFDEDSEIRTLAEQGMQVLQEEVTITETSRDTGFGWRVPDSDILSRLESLFLFSEPFELPEAA